MSQTHRIPAAGVGFLGRAGEVAELSQLLLECERLVTLTGAPGIGKTRLAMELAAELGDGFAGGAHLVELAPVARGGAVPGAVAAALSVHEQPGQELIETIAARLGERRVLLVLDNCEHLISGCAELVEALLSSCPRLRIIATSRERLGLAAERVWEVPPLPVPEPEEEGVPEGLLSFAAVALFVEHAAAVQPGFSLTAYVAPAVAEICRRLDGIPLAIELAGARVEMLTPAEIARRLDDRFGLLTRGARGALSRHQTLTAALDFSHELLSPAERTLLRRLSVFVAGFDVEAAEAVCAGVEVTEAVPGAADVAAGDVRDMLAALASKSLVLADGADSRGGHRLLETIRAYAADRLDEAGEQAALREAHARFYLALAERAEPELTGPEQAIWLARLDSQRENLRSAIEWSLSSGRAEWALRLAGALVLFWRVRGNFGKGRDLLNAVVSIADDQAPGLRAKALWGAGFLAMMAGDPEGALPLLEESLSCFRELGDRQGCARSLLILANCRQPYDDPTVPSLLDESIALARGAGDLWCLAHALGVAGFEATRREGLPAARPLFAECLAVAREAEDQQSLRMGLLGMGSLAVHQGDYALAESMLEEALAVARDLGEDFSAATALVYLGRLALGRGHYGRARALLDEAMSLLPDSSPPGAVLGALLLLGKVAHARGDRPAARAIFDDVLTRAGKRMSPVLQARGELAAAEGDHDQARRLFQEALDLARAAGNEMSSAEALHGLGRLARMTGNSQRAATLHGDAMDLQRRIGDAPGIADTLEAIAGLAVDSGRHREGARLLGAAEALRQRRGYACAPWEAGSREADLVCSRQVLSEAEFEAALSAGAALSTPEALAEASSGWTRPTRPATGWTSLTKREHQVAELVADGLSNPAIAERLVVSLGTVKTHLSHIFAKLGVRGRTELAHDVWCHRQ